MDPTIRPAEPSDATAIAHILRAARLTAMPWLSHPYTPEQDLAFVAGHMLPGAETWVAIGADGVEGFLSRRGKWIEHLYVEPARRGRGIGSMLLRTAMAGRDSLALWVFQRNAPARDFYERHDFRPVAFTDGSGNEEQEPDVRYAWCRRSQERENAA
jgi:GNAT superfamily N-acetyltransferase